MKLAWRGLAALTFAFALSQFYRSCLAVMAPELQRDFQLSPAGFGALSSSFFLAFAVAQIPVGIAFDRFGVGRPSVWLLAVGAVSSVLFAVAPNGGLAVLSQAGLGLACAPVFMGLLHYAADRLDEKDYTRVVGKSNAIGMIGALCATAPLGWAAQHVGWRPAMGLAAVCMSAACFAVWRNVRDHGHAQARDERLGGMLWESVKLLRLAPLWTLIPMCIAMAAGTTFRNAWGGPYLAEVFGLDAASRGIALTVLSLTSFLTAFILPVLVRRGSLPATIAGWACLSMLGGAMLAIWPDGSIVGGVALLSLLTSIGMLHPLVMAQGRGMIPPAARGRGLGLLNTFVFLGSALAAWSFGLVADFGHDRNWPVARIYSSVFALATLLLGAALAAYLFRRKQARA